MKSFRADGSAAIAAFSRVKVTAGVLTAAGVSERGIGVIQEAVFNNSLTQHVAVKLWTSPGTFKVIVASAVAADATAYAAASGKTNDAVNGFPLGKYLEAGTGNGSIVEMLPIFDYPTMNLEHNTASATLTRAQRNSVQTNLGASGAVTLTLPQDAIAGDRFHFNAMAAQELRVDPGAAGAIYIGGAKQTDDKYVSFDDEAEHLTLTADGNGDWIAGPSNGTFTVES